MDFKIKSSIHRANTLVQTNRLVWRQLEQDQAFGQIKVSSA